MNKRDQFQYAKEYAMGCMLNEALRRENFDLSQKDVSLTVYTEVGDLSLNLTNAIDKMAKSSADSIKQSQIGDYEGKKTIVANCLAFTDS